MAPGLWPETSNRRYAERSGLSFWFPSQGVEALRVVWYFVEINEQVDEQKLFRVSIDIVSPSVRMKLLTLCDDGLAHFFFLILNFNVVMS